MLKVFTRAKAGYGEYRLHRFVDTGDESIGVLYKVVDGKLIYISLTLEDEFRTEKVYGETRIPEDRYEIKERRAGTLYKRYSEKWNWHEGMLELQDVPGFSYIYFHPGNYDWQTDGCIMVGENLIKDSGKYHIENSQIIYEPFYKDVILHLHSGEKAFVTIQDFDRIRIPKMPWFLKFT